MKINKQSIVSAAIILAVAVSVLSLPAQAATSVAKFDEGAGTLSVTGSCSGRYVLIVIKNSSNGSIWGSSNPPCTSGSYDYSIDVPDGVRTGGAFSVSAVDNGTSGSSTVASQPIIFSAPAPVVEQTISIALDTSTLTAAPDGISMLDSVIQNIFGIITSAANAVESSVVAAVQLFAKIFTIVPGGSITVPKGQNQISGQSSLAAGATSVFIPNTAVTSSSQIIITPTSPSLVPLAVTQITGGDGFDVGTISPQQISVSFTWFIINTYAAGPPTPAGLQSVPALAPAPATAPMPAATPPPTPASSSSSTATSSAIISVTSTSVVVAPISVASTTTKTIVTANTSSSATITTTDTTGTPQ